MANCRTQCMLAVGLGGPCEEKSDEDGGCDELHGRGMLSNRLRLRDARGSFTNGLRSLHTTLNFYD
jgi:hypothetical protein